MFMSYYPTILPRLNNFPSNTDTSNQCWLNAGPAVYAVFPPNLQLHEQYIKSGVYFLSGRPLK